MFYNVSTKGTSCSILACDYIKKNDISSQNPLSTQNFYKLLSLIQNRKNIEFFTGIFLNSVLGVLSFNSFDFYVMLGKTAGDMKERLHSSKFWKQVVYNINILVTYLV